MMTFESSSTPLQSDVLHQHQRVEWTPIIVGALAATALSFVLVTFAATIGLGVSSTAPTWRDASTALWLLSGLYLILQALLSFAFGGYVAARVRSGGAWGKMDASDTDGFHGLAVWALAVVIGAVLAAIIGSAALSSRSTATPSARTSAAEPLLSYELDRLYRAGRRANAVDLTAERAEAGRILLTSSGHNGVSADDRAYLVQQVGTTTGVNGADAEKRVDAAITNAKTSIDRSRRSTIILAFSVATALLLGAVAAWMAASAAGRHRDGAPLPHWMGHSNLIDTHRTRVQR
jgi:hypothetical protein